MVQGNQFERSMALNSKRSMASSSWLTSFESIRTSPPGHPPKGPQETPILAFKKQPEYACPPSLDLPILGRTRRRSAVGGLGSMSTITIGEGMRFGMGVDLSSQLVRGEAIAFDSINNQTGGQIVDASVVM